MARKRSNRCASCGGPKRRRRKYCSQCKARRCRVKCRRRRKNPGISDPKTLLGLGLAGAAVYYLMHKK